MPTAVRRSMFAVLLLIAGGAAVAMWYTPSAPAPPSAEFVPTVTPDANEQLPRQGRIKINVRSGYTGQLVVNQKPIPAAQVSRQDAGLATHQELIFQPGPGKVFEFFPGGQNCASLTYWRVDTPDQKFTKNWCFNVV